MAMGTTANGVQDILSTKPVHEVLVGRIPVYGTNYAALDSILVKTMAYETEGDISWRDNMLLPMAISNYANEDNGGTRVRRPIVGGVHQERSCRAERLGTLHDVRKIRADSRDGCLRCPDHQREREERMVHKSLRDRRLVGARQLDRSLSKVLGKRRRRRDPEGSEMSSPAFFSSSDASILDDTHPSIVTQVSCTNGYPESSTNLGYKLLERRRSEHIPAHESLGTQPPIGIRHRDGLRRRRIVCLLQHEAFGGESKHRTTAAALQWCRENLGTGWGGSSWMNSCDFNLYGDPAIMLGSGGTTPPGMQIVPTWTRVKLLSASISATDPRLCCWTSAMRRKPARTTRPCSLATAPPYGHRPLPRAPTATQRPMVSRPPPPMAMTSPRAADDEDGVVFTSALVGGQMATVDVIASAAGGVSSCVDRFQQQRRLG